jgi:hypothetical protein
VEEGAAGNAFKMPGNSFPGGSFHEAGLAVFVTEAVGGRYGGGGQGKGYEQIDIGIKAGDIEDHKEEQVAYEGGCGYDDILRLQPFESEWPVDGLVDGIDNC